MPDVDVCHCYTVCISDHHKHQQVGRDQTECQYICEPTLLCAARRGKYDTVVTNLLYLFFFQKMFKQFCVDLLIVFIPFTLKYLESVFYMMILETTNVYVDTSNEIVVFLDCKGNYKCGTCY